MASENTTDDEKQLLAAVRIALLQVIEQAIGPAATQDSSKPDAVPAPHRPTEFAFPTGRVPSSWAEF